MAYEQIVVGLGNPGAEYERTRHNVGFRFVEYVLDRFGPAHVSQATSWRDKFQSLVTEANIAGSRTLLLKPQTYMNLSGDAVGEALRFYKLGPGDLVVVHDEIDLPLGTARLKQGGGEAGHNGLRSISQRLGSRDYMRLRLGIGRRPAQAAAASEANATRAEDQRAEDQVDRAKGKGRVSSWVLGRFTADEEHILDDVMESAALALVDLFNDGLKRAQNRLHKKRDRQ